MRIAVIGCGYWGSKHVRVLHQSLGVERLVIVDPQTERLRALRANYPGIEAHTRIEDALRSIDAAVLATPASSHAPIGISLMEAGKHLLVEKPLATSVAEATVMRDTAEAMGVTLAVGHTFEHNAAVLALRELIRRGDLGQVYYIDAARLNLGLYQNDCNVIWDLAPHDISIANLLLDDTPDLVQANGSAHAQRFQEDVAYLRMTYSRQSVTVQVHVSWLDPCKVRRVTVVGSEKMAVYNDMLTEEPIRIYDKGVEVLGGDQDLSQRPASYRYGGIHSPYVRFHEPLMAQDLDFVDSILEERAPISDARRGLAVVAALEAANRSMREGGRPVPVADFGMRSVLAS